MKIRQKIAGISVLALGLAMAGPAFAEDAPDYDPQLDLGSGVTVYTVQDFQGAGAKAECLAGVKKWRQDALDDNVKWPNPDSSTTMRQYLAENGVSETEYLAPKWSQELERITMERVAETAVHGKRGHYRSNDESIFSLRPNAPGGMYEIIAWHVTGGCTERIDQWAGEKEYWVNQTDGETGHYETLIDPDVLHYGFAGLNDADTLGNFISPSVWVGQGFSGDLADESAVEYQGKATIPINITEDAANQGADLSQNEMMVDETATLKATTKAHNGKAFFRGDWTSSDPAIASITKDGVITGVSGGTVTLTLTIPEGNVFTFPYTVKAAQIVSVADPAGVTTESGTAPVLPDMVTATYDDDSVKDVEVTWDAIDEAQYSAREGGQFTVNGTVAGWDNPVTITVTVNPATITGVDPETTDHTVESGEKPVLPDTTSATWSNGDTTEETITWDEINEADYSAREGGDFTVAGAVAGWADGVSANVHVNPASITSVEDVADVTTYVEEAPALPETTTATWSNGDTTTETITWDEVAEADYAEAGSFVVNGSICPEDVCALDVTVTVLEHQIVSIADPAGVTTESGTAPVLPDMVSATYDDDTVADVAVTWDEIEEAQYSARTGGEFTVNGTVEGWDDPVTITVTVNPATITGVDPASTDHIVASGEKPELPATTTATWSNGDTTDETITWDEMDEADYSAREGGDFTVNGTVEGWADGVSANVTVTPATIEKIEVTEEITTPAGIHPDLPGTVMVHWSNGDVTEAEPTWEELDELDYAQPTVLDVAGSVCGGPECDFTAQVTVTEAIIVSVSHDDPVVTDSGTAPVLPDTGTAIWSDKMAGDVTLVWDEIDPAHYMAREGGEFTVNGTVDGEDFPVTITVQVNPATKELVADIDPVTTDSGTAPTLPETVTVMWSNGDVTEEPVTWDEIDEADYSGIGGGHFTVNGTVEGMEEGVSVDVHVNPATIDSAELAEEVTTPAGVAPEMPETVMVHWSNGDVTEEPVTWHEIDEADYAQSGVIDVTGQLCPDSECVFTVPVTVTDPVDEPTDEPSGQPTDEPTDQPTKPSDQPTHPKDPGKHPAKDPGKHPTHPGKYGNDLPHTGSSVAMLGLISFLMLATGGVLARRYARS